MSNPLDPEMMSPAERLEEAASLLGRNSPFEDERVRGHRVLLSPDTLGLLPVCNGPEESTPCVTYRSLLRPPSADCEAQAQT